jgi:hypothetical protein
MVGYDPQVIQRYAEHLYLRARGMVLICMLGGVVFGGAAGALIGGALGYGPNMAIALAGAVLFGLLGFPVGLERSFALRAEAQKLLCMTRIEQGLGKRG